MKQFKFHFTLRELFVWIALGSLAAGICIEHKIARDFELATRTGVEQIFQQMFSGHQ